MDFPAAALERNCQEKVVGLTFDKGGAEKGKTKRTKRTGKDEKEGRSG